MKRRQFGNVVEPRPVRVPDPNGPYPACKNQMGTYACERCGQDVRTAHGVCPAVAPEDRWRFSTNDDT